MNSKEECIFKFTMEEIPDFGSWLSSAVLLKNLSAAMKVIFKYFETKSTENSF